MTEVDGNLYGMFVDCVEDVAIGSVTDDNFEPYARQHNETRTVFEKFFKAMEKVNIPLAESNESLTSMSSFSSVSNLSRKSGSQMDLGTPFTPAIFFRAVESFTLNESSSTSALNNLDNSMPVSKPMDHPTLVQFIMKALEEFLIENAANSDDENASHDFPKFC
jgi:hypothetical protein